ncbi:MAG TPA: hypothetical protein VFT79_07640 [Solirubrobacterales bacterium]|nr:hypothetical protein [Solirubrobacterales bacterium]
MVRLERAGSTHRLGWAGLLASLLVALCVAPATASAPLRADFHNCGDIPPLSSWDIRAKRVGCTKAKQVVRRFVETKGSNDVSTQDVLGFRCKTSGSYYDGAYYRCTASGRRVIRFTRGV